MNLNLLILGAGASHCVGYPLANEMVASLEAFGQQINAPEQCDLQKKTRELVSEMQRRGVSTVDEYARQLFDPRDSDAKEYGEKCEPAKRIIAAFFRWLEPAAITKLGPWKELINEVLPFNCLGDTQTCSWRVMTFNYDRVFEMAVKETYPEFFHRDRSEDLERILNRYCSKELNDLPGPPEDGRFALLKMHGSIGYRGSLTPHPTGMILQPKSAFDAGSPLQNNEVNNAFLSSKDEIFEHIAFPWDAGARPTTNKQLTGWCSMMDEAAKKWMSQVVRIKVIGYSLPHLNEPRFTNLMDLAAGSCRCLEVVEPCETLRSKWEVFAATHFSNAKLVWHGKSF